MSSIVFVSAMAGSPWGGSEELWSNSAIDLCGRGFAVSASVKAWPQLSPRIAVLKESGVEVQLRHSPPSKITSRLVRKLLRKNQRERRWLTSRRPRLVVISQGGNNDGLEWMELCRSERLPFVAVVQCNSEYWWPKDKLSAMMAEAYGAAQNVFCVSRHNLELLQQQCGALLENSAVVHNPYNVSPETSITWPKGNVFRLACVARLEPSAKGQDILLHVLAEPRWKQRNVEVNFYGTGLCAETLRWLADHLGLRNVFFRGYTTNIEEIWSHHQLLLLPSRYEGLPLALVESMWSRRPAVVTDVGGNSELCSDGVSGFIANGATVSSFSEAMERAWNCRARWPEMGVAARGIADRLVPRNPIELFSSRLARLASD